MDDSTTTRTVPRSLMVGALALGLLGGGYGIASAASGGSSGTTQGTAPPSGSAPAAPSGQPWGQQRSDETPLTGDALARVKAAAKSKVSGATVIRVETDADGHAAYEAHMVKADGTPVTVYVDKSFAVVGVETRPSRP